VQVLHKRGPKHLTERHALFSPIRTILVAGLDQKKLFKMSSLLLGLCAAETILRIPLQHQMALQFRNGAVPLLAELAMRQKQGKLEVTIMTHESEFFGTKLFAPITTKFPGFKLLTDANGAAGACVLERHWRQRALELHAQSTLRFLLVGTRKTVNTLWRPDEVLVVEPYLAFSKEERARRKAEGKLPDYANDHSMTNLLHVVDDLISAPTASVTEVLRTSPFVRAMSVPQLGSTFALSAAREVAATSASAQP